MAVEASGWPVEVRRGMKATGTLSEGGVRLEAKWEGFMDVVWIWVGAVGIMYLLIFVVLVVDELLFERPIRKQLTHQQALYINENYRIWMKVCIVNTQAQQPLLIFETGKRKLFGALKNTARKNRFKRWVKNGVETQQQMPFPIYIDGALKI